MVLTLARTRRIVEENNTTITMMMTRKKRRINILFSAIVIILFPSDHHNHFFVQCYTHHHHQHHQTPRRRVSFQRNNVVLHSIPVNKKKRKRFSWLLRNNNNVDEQQEELVVNGNYNNGQQQQKRRRSPFNISNRVYSALSVFRSSNGKKNDDDDESERVNGKVVELKDENDRLRDTIRKLQVENEKLHQQQLIVLETFEGEGKLNKLEWFNDLAQAEESITLSEGEMNVEYLEDDDECVVADDDGNLLGTNRCPLEPTISFSEAFRDRAFWLVGLLIMQSASGVILAKNEALIANHPVIVYFLTMLVGAGGNAGNQASVRVIRGLALGTLNEQTQNQFLMREFKMSVALSAVLSLAGFVRAAVFRTPFPETVAVTVALALIVFSSICLGAVLPLVLKRIGVDPAHSSTTIQVIMDILGVLLAVAVSGLILDSPIGNMLVAKLTGG